MHGKHSLYLYLFQDRRSRRGSRGELGDVDGGGDAGHCFGVSSWNKSTRSTFTCCDEDDHFLWHFDVQSVILQQPEVVSVQLAVSKDVVVVISPTGPYIIFALDCFLSTPLPYTGPPLATLLLATLLLATLAQHATLLK
jgi:hypothetical protein